MGAAASILTADDASNLAKELREDYEKLKNEGLSEDDIQMKLTSKYNDLIAKQQKGNENNSDTKTTGLGLGKKAGGAGGKAHKARKRRGTFENEKTFSPSAKKDPAPTVVSDPSALIARIDASLGAAPADTTESKAKASVTLPTISSLAKKTLPEDIGTGDEKRLMPQNRRRMSTTEGFEARGTRRRSFLQTKNANIPTRKFSNSASRPEIDPALIASASEPLLAQSTSGDMPENGESADCWESVTEQPFCPICEMAFNTTAKLEQHINFSVIHAKNVKKESDDVIASELASVGVPPNENHQEGVHYKLMYSGSKFFWRTQETIDLDFYHHVETKCVEVIAFDVQTHKELKRLYLDLTKIVEIVRSDVEAVIEGKKKSADRFSTLNIPQMMEEEQRLQLTTFIISRLQLDQESPTKGVKFFSQDMRPLLELPPVRLTPVQVARRRKTNDEPALLMQQIAADREAIGQSTKMAAIASELGK